MTQDEKRLNRIVDCLKNNKIPYNSKIIDVFDVPYSFQDYEKLAINIIDDLEEIVNYGMNQGFSRQSKKVCKNLSDMIMKLTQKSRRNQIEYFKKERSEIMGGLNLSSKSTGLDIKKPIINLLEDTLVGLDVLSNKKNKTERYVEICNQLKDTMEDAKSKIESSYDNYSIEAMKKCNILFQSIMHARKMVGRMIITKAEATTIISEISKNANEWFDLKDSKRKKARKEHFSKVTYLEQIISIDEIDYSTFEDNFYIVSKSQEFREKFEVLNEQINDFKQKTKSVDNTDNLRAKITEAESQAREHIARIKELGAKVKAKQISEKEAILIASREDKLVKQFQKDVKRYQTELTYAETSNLSRKKLINSLDDVVTKIKQNEDNEVVQYLYYKNLDIESIGSLLSGSGSQEECEKAIESLITGIEISNKQEIKFREISMQTERSFDESYRQLYKELDRLDQEEMENNLGIDSENKEDVHSSLSNIFSQYSDEEDEDEKLEESENDNFEDIFGNYN